MINKEFNIPILNYDFRIFIHNFLKENNIPETNSM